MGMTRGINVSLIRHTDRVTFFIYTKSLTKTHPDWLPIYNSNNIVLKGATAVSLVTLGYCHFFSSPIFKYNLIDLIVMK